MEGEMNYLNPTDGQDKINESISKRYSHLNKNAQKKKKFIIGGIIAGVLLIGLIVTLVLVLKSKDHNDPNPPPDIFYFDPYVVTESNDQTMTYTLERDTKLNFQYPYSEQDNNKLLNKITLQGSVQNGNVLQLNFNGKTTTMKSERFLEE